MRIWDLHCHLPSTRMPPGTLTEQVGRMLEIAGRVGIEKIGLFLKTGKPEGPDSDDEILRALTRYQGRVHGRVLSGCCRAKPKADDGRTGCR